MGIHDEQHQSIITIYIHCLHSIEERANLVEKGSTIAQKGGVGWTQTKIRAGRNVNQGREKSEILHKTLNLSDCLNSSHDAHSRKGCKFR